MPKTLLILNPHAASGRTTKIWEKVEPLLRKSIPDLTTVVTQDIQDINAHIQSAYKNNVEQIIGIGGDGTNHSIINAILKEKANFPEHTLPIYGTLPVGTGCDWARSQGIPSHHKSAIEWLTNATPQPTDIGFIEFEGQQRYFLNIASAGLSGVVDSKVNRVVNRRPWTFFRATIETLLTYNAPKAEIKIDGITWFENQALLTVIANGTTFGHGMKIAPNAKHDDGLFDVIHIEMMPLVNALIAFRRVYNGSHLTHAKVHHTRAKSVEIISTQSPIDLDLDGDHAQAKHIRFEIKPKLLRLLT